MAVFMERVIAPNRLSVNREAKKQVSYMYQKSNIAPDTWVSTAKMAQILYIISISL